MNRLMNKWIIFFLLVSLPMMSCKKEEGPVADDTSNNNNSGNSNEPDDDNNNTPGLVAANNTIEIDQDDKATTRVLKRSTAWTAFGNVVVVQADGTHEGVYTRLRVTLGPGVIPSADRSYELQGIAFTSQNEKASLDIQTSTGSANTWYSASDLGGEVKAKINSNGSITFSFDNVTTKVSAPPYQLTKVFSGKFTIPADYTVGSTSGEAVYDLVD